MRKSTPAWIVQDRGSEVFVRFGNDCRLAHGSPVSYLDGFFGGQGMSACRRACGLRKGRASEVGQVYSISCVTADRESVFACWRSARLLVAQLRAMHESGDVESLAWVVMPDHMHWLFQLRKGNLATVICRMKARSSWPSIAATRLAAGFGRKAATTERCAAKTTCERQPATSS